MISSKFQFLCIVLLLVVFIAPLFSQTPSQLFQQGLLKENGEGDLKVAVAIYEKIIGDETADRSLRAKAQLHIGQCYEKLGLKEAKKAYQKVIDNYPAQNEVVKIAKEKLTILQKAEAVIKKATKELTVRKILADPGMNDHGDYWCTISPDGRYITFVDNLNLMVRDLVTGKNRKLTTNGSLETREFAEHSVFSPDGQQIAYDRHNEDQTWDLCLIGFDGSQHRVLVHRENGDYIWPIEWSPDGKRILTAFFRKDSLSLTGEIVFISAEDGSFEIIKPTHKTAFSNITEMDISPDGRYIVYHAKAVDGSKQNNLYLLSSDGKQDFPLIKHPADEHSPTWTPDGKRILFVSERNGTPGFWIINVVNGKAQGSPVLMKSGIGQFGGSIGFTEQGAYYYKLENEMQDVFVAEIDSETYKLQGDPDMLEGLTQGSNMEPAWSPDGQCLAYYRESSIVIHSLQSGKERELSNNLIKHGGLQWFPDGRSLLVSALRAPKDFRFDYYRVNVETGETSLILQRENGTGTPWPGLSPDGKTIYFTYFDHGEPNNVLLFSYQIEIRQEKELYRIGPDRKVRQSIVVSPDGRQLAFVDHEGSWPISSVVKVIPVEGGQAKELLRIPWPGYIPGNRCLTWTRDGKSLLVAKAASITSDSGALLLIPVEGGESREVGLTAKYLQSMSIHPDGNRMIYSGLSKSPATEVWVMENFLHEFEAGVVKIGEDKKFKIRKVWVDPAMLDICGATSPDGRYLSYVDWETGGDIAICELATGNKRRLTNKSSWDESDEHAQFNSRWSPDGKQIVYQWYNGKGYNDLRIIGLDGSKPRILYSNKEVNWTHAYDWSLDGKQILAFFEKKEETGWITQIVLVSTADGSVRVLKTFDGDWPENMCFSPDGRYIVYDLPQNTGSKERDIFLLSSDGIHEVKLIEHPSHDELLGWAPDGKNIIFASDRNGTFSLWIMQVAEGKPQGTPKLVKSSMGPVKPLGFTRKGSFYYGISQKRNNIYIAELDPETGDILDPPKMAITRFEGYNQTPVYSPDGKYLAYISRRFPLTIFPDYTIARIGGNVLCIKSLETGKEREILPDLDRFSFPCWSPDGHSVIVSDMESGAGLNQIDTQTGNITPVLQSNDDIGFSEYLYSPDGKTIFIVCSDRETKIDKILVRDIESGTEKEIYQSDAPLRISLSPDGQWLAVQTYFFMSEETPCLNIIPSAGGEPRELCRFEEGIDIHAGAPFTWTADGKYILFTVKTNKKDDKKGELYRIPAEGGEIEKLGLEINGFIINLSAHPDGRHIAFSSSEHPVAEIWVMENFLPE